MKDVQKTELGKVHMKHEDVGVPLSKALDPVQVYLILGPDL